MARTVSVYIEKGGSTKSTTTVHLAHASAKNGVRVLIADVDAQCHASHWLIPSLPSITINEVVRRPELIRQAIVPSRIVGADVLYGSRKLPLVAEAVLKQDEDGNPRNPFEVLKRLLADVADEYDLILIDCSPSVSLMNTNALVAADHVLVPTDLADMSFAGIEDVARTLVQMHNNGLIKTLPPITVLLNSLENDDSKTTREIRERITSIAERERAPYTLLQHTVRYRKQMKGIYHTHQTAFDLAADGGFRYRHLQPVARDYEAAAAEFLSLLLRTDTHPSDDASRIAQA